MKFSLVTFVLFLMCQLANAHSANYLTLLQIIKKEQKTIAAIENQRAIGLVKAMNLDELNLGDELPYQNPWTPLIWAAHNNHTDIVNALLERKIDINAKNM